MWLVLTHRRLEGVAALAVGGLPALAVSAWAFGQPGLAEDGQPYSVRYDDGVRFGFVLAVASVLVLVLAYFAARYEEHRPPTPELAHTLLRWAAVAAGVMAVVAVALLFVAADPWSWSATRCDDFTSPRRSPSRRGRSGSRASAPTTAGAGGRRRGTPSLTTRYAAGGRDVPARPPRAP